MSQKPSIRPFELDPSEAEIELVEEDFHAPVPTSPEPPPAPKRSTAWLWGLGAVGALGAIIMQAVSVTTTMLAESTWIGLPFTAFMLAIAAAAIGLFGREYGAFRRLKRQDQVRQQAERLVTSELHGDADPVLGQLVVRYQDMAPKDVALYRKSVNDSLNDGECIRLFERTVLAQVDKRAHRVVLESSRDIGILTALSPLGLLDGLLVLWRTLIMTRRLAEIYGLRPSSAAGFMLLRRSLRNAVLAGVADVVTHSAVEHVGAGLLALLSARAGQGAGNALLAARLGLETIRQVRPLAFVEMPEPKLADVRKALLEAPDAKFDLSQMNPMASQRDSSAAKR